MFVTNLPDTTKSNNTFLKTFLRSINSKNHKISTNILTSDQESYLDDDYKIVSILRPKNCRNYCFIDFAHPDYAINFLKTFKNNLIIKSKKVEIELAKHDPYWRIAKSDLSAFRKLQKHQRQKHDPEGFAKIKQKRRLRRLRSRLRRKGVSDEAIIDICARIIKNRQSVLEKKPRLSTELNTTVTDGEIQFAQRPSSYIPKIVDVGGNPPNKTLLVQGLPDDITESELSNIFASDELVQVRLVKVWHLAFVEYSSIVGATKAKENLGSTHRISNTMATIGFAK